jgi:hypothetical protein
VNDVEHLLVRTLHDERRAVATPTGVAVAVQQAARRLELRRRLAVGAAAVVTVIVIAGGTMLADGGSAQDGKVPSFNASVSAEPRTS